MLALIHAVLLAATESDEGGLGFIGLLFLLTGPGFYAYVFIRYRNADKRHRHETETKSTKLNLVATDEKIRTLTGLSNSRMSGANNTAVTGAGGFPTSMGELKGLAGQLNPLMQKIQQQATKAASTSTVPDSDASGAGAAAPTALPPSGPPPAAPPSGAPTTPPPSSPPPPGPPPGSGQAF